LITAVEIYKLANKISLPVCHSAMLHPAKIQNYKENAGP